MSMNGAESLVKTLESLGVDTCFTNPGTSEIHLVDALGKADGIRSVLCLHETVASGAADGYGRMRRRPAMTLLHLAPGLANASANLHNAAKAMTPVMSVIGEHATWHRDNRPPLYADIAGLARVWSRAVLTCEDPRELSSMGAEAYRSSLEPPGGISTLIVPSDVSWGEAGDLRPLPDQVPAWAKPDEKRITAAVSALKGEGPSGILMSGRACADEGCLSFAAGIAAATGALLIADTFVPRMARGAGRGAIERLPYLNDAAGARLRGLKSLILVGAGHPVSFFAYPGKPGLLAPPGCAVHVLAEPHEDPRAALQGLAALLNVARGTGRFHEEKKPPLPAGEISMEKVAAAVAALMPRDAIVSDESNTSGVHLFAATETAAPHDWLFLTGGSIGQCLPVGTGAALACPGRKVLCLESDGSAMYSLPALWTMARENLDVTTVIFSNRSYAILKIEWARMGFPPMNERVAGLFDLARPGIDFVSIARGMGVEAARPATAAEFTELLGAALERKGPSLIEVVV